MLLYIDNTEILSTIAPESYSFRPPTGVRFLYSCRWRKFDENLSYVGSDLIKYAQNVNVLFRATSTALELYDHIKLNQLNDQFQKVNFRCKFTFFGCEEI